MKKILLALLLCSLASLGIAQQIQQFSSNSIMDAQITTGAGSAYQVKCQLRTYDASGTTTAGVGAATIQIQGSNVFPPTTLAGDWVLLGTITLTLGTAKTADGFSSFASWRSIRANVSAISGTNASVDVRVGC